MIKGQALRDVIVETKDMAETIQNSPNMGLSEEPSGMWKVLVDGASRPGQYGARVLVNSPKGIEMQYAQRFSFDITSNEAEYEALCAVLRITNSLKVQSLAVFFDSHIIVNQVPRQYQAKEERMKWYLKKVTELR